MLLYVISSCLMKKVTWATKIRKKINNFMRKQYIDHWYYTHRARNYVVYRMQPVTAKTACDALFPRTLLDETNWSLQTKQKFHYCITIFGKKLFGKNGIRWQLEVANTTPGTFLGRKVSSPTCGQWKICIVIQACVHTR